MKDKTSVTEILQEIDKMSTNKEQEDHITKEFLILDCHSRLIGIQIEYLREVFELKDDNAISPIPFTPSYILGIIHIRGEIIPVLSLSEILKIEEKEFSLLKLVVIENQFKIAFPVKNILDMKAIKVKEIRAIRDISTKAEEQFISDEFDYNGKQISVMDIQKFYLSNYIL
ncbi:MAG: chemotaxis protein CheW [Spirochaetales bacterium]|nr:chemotaxis protein CheW [Spirochaetales bacterium]